MNKVNPFNITKAVDYSDEQINKFWVDIPEGSGFNETLKPTSPMPMIILGAKGSGKTHIMRYFSFNLQKLRWQDSIMAGAQSDGFLGIYMRCSGLNSNRFSGKNQSKEAWKEIFSFYMELWLSQLILTDINEILEKIPIETIVKQKICEEIIDLFDIDLSEFELNSIEEIIKFLRKNQKQVDYEVNNCALTGDKITDIKICATSGSLIFGIPKILEKELTFFKDIKFMYLLDEFENLSEPQQIYVNTLIREKQDPATFKIGTRLYGIKTYLTYSGGEELKEGSEYEIYNIDNVFRQREKDYSSFVEQICFKRLKVNGYPIETPDELGYYINKPEYSSLIESKLPLTSKPYFSKLEANLKEASTKKEIEEIIRNLSYNEDVFIERTNLFVFYKEWKKKKRTKETLVELSKIVKNECERYIADKREKGKHHKVLDKYKNDIQDQLLRELRLEVFYLGIDNFIKMSSGMPRNLLIILKHIYRWSTFNDEKSFSNGNVVSITSQTKGLSEATKWFLNDARIKGDEENLVQLGLQRLGRFLQELRFSDQPPECSISTFSISTTGLEPKITSILSYLEMYSYLIKIKDRREKNSNKRSITYQFNGLVAANWELSIHRRGVVTLNEVELKAIFIPANEQEFDRVLNSRVSKCNSPFSSHLPSLFKD